jgi:tetratricopeptide (TPR) repeat protein
VRARVWASSLELLAAHPLLGVGPGQFAARFPPYRDPREIELSTHGRALPVETEVEHPHEDWIAPSLDLGGIAGLVWIVFLLVVAANSLRALRPIAVESDPSRATLGAAATAALAYAVVHAPFTYEPAAASIAFVAFGAVLPRGRPFRPWPVLITFVAAPAALGLVTHGRSLALLARPGEQDVVVVAAAIERALNACPDSPLARTLRARLCEERGDDPKLVAEAWTHVLKVRPHRVEAIMQLAFAHLRTGEPERAREEYRRALALDRTHPGIVKNLRLLDLQEGRFESGREWLDEADPSPETCFARAKAERDGGDALLADLLEARAHLDWARQHADAGRFEDAVRSYRQSLRVTRDHVAGGARRVRLEFAAALAESGRESDARTEIADLGTRAGDREALPRWAAERLARLGVAGF